MVTYAATIAAAVLAITAIATPQVSVEAAAAGPSPCAIFEQNAPTITLFKVANQYVWLRSDFWAPSADGKKCTHNANIHKQEYKQGKMPTVPGVKATVECCLEFFGCMRMPGSSSPKPWGQFTIADYKCNVYEKS
ncbi:hypothetical protein BDF19DRAFT_498304 [Syncephalis fuscata]|nr:hypothetical protein BDF19DRAFT_498304 [Syncephalis fuscata]